MAKCHRRAAFSGSGGHEENYAFYVSRWSIVYLGMSWFIFRGICFAAFWCFVLRTVLVRLIGGEAARPERCLARLRPEWPLLSNPDNTRFAGPEGVIGWNGLPLINTILLLLSSVTVTFAHHGINEGNRSKIINWLIATVVLGIAFLFCQAYEYYEAYAHYGLTLDSGIFGSTFFMLTGFHGAHVTIGTIMLLVMLGRAIKGHFTATDCFGFEAAAWYWHFVDVVWVLLFIFVYILGT